MLFLLDTFLFFSTKVLRNGLLLIERNGVLVLYTPSGQIVK